ncbi:MmcQ/YjbR family DNA-binding protein [Tsukamurella sp. NPDC003166]|uniref:MmcQ/YjbR family DNA-binding protein n=1 Tax=Tsukamurella sp. NPDC003166 TaxID=3154444 RepID=UPI0033B803B9
MARAARVEDVAAIAQALPRVVEIAGWGGRPAWQVSKKVFCGNRSPRPDAVDGDGARLDDVILIRTPDESDKLALVQADGPFFTTPHFDGYNAVLIRASRLGEISRDELREVIEDAWCACAPKTVVRAWLAEHDR